MAPFDPGRLLSPTPPQEWLHAGRRNPNATDTTRVGFLPVGRPLARMLKKRERKTPDYFKLVKLATCNCNPTLTTAVDPLLPPAAWLLLPRLRHLHEAVLDLHRLVDAEPRPLRPVRWGVEVVLELHCLVAAEHGLQAQHGGRQAGEMLCLSDDQTGHGGIGW